MLEKYGFVLLVGEAGAGKSTIAATLAMAAIDQWGCSTLKIDEPAGVAAHWNPHEPSQFFWIDDAFGVTQYEFLLAYGWNRAFPRRSFTLLQGCRFPPCLDATARGPASRRSRATGRGRRARPASAYRDMDAVAPARKV